MLVGEGVQVVYAAGGYSASWRKGKETVDA